MIAKLSFSKEHSFKKNIASSSFDWFLWINSWRRTAGGMLLKKISVLLCKPLDCRTSCKGLYPQNEWTPFIGCLFAKKVLPIPFQLTNTKNEHRLSSWKTQTKHMKAESLLRDSVSALFTLLVSHFASCFTSKTKVFHVTFCDCSIYILISSSSQDFLSLLDSSSFL